jgi:hypothetical protein
MIPVYMLMVEYADGRRWLATDTKNKLVIAKEENAHLLARMGQALLDDEDLTVIGYQLLCTAEEPVRKSGYRQL